ncbi:hypothetical protein [Lysobacter humi (ex Lee et al. 2017)]
MRPGSAADHPQRVQAAFEAVRDLWIAEGRHAALARVILANWTAGNCVDFMAPLTAVLLDAREPELHAHLWRRTIKRQVDGFFHWLGQVPGRPTYLRLRNRPTTGFVEGDQASCCDAERVAAALLQRLSADLHRWRQELRSAGLPADEPDRIEHRLLLLKKPTIKPGRFPVGEATKPAADEATHST